MSAIRKPSGLQPGFYRIGHSLGAAIPAKVERDPEGNWSLTFDGILRGSGPDPWKIPGMNITCLGGHRIDELEYKRLVSSRTASCPA